MPAQPSKTREEAKRILAAIVQLAGGRFEGKTRLFKAFYAAHLFYWRDAHGVLTSHAIVNMPRGPGVADRRVFSELESSGVIATTSQSKGPHRETVYTALKNVEFTEDEEAAIRNALGWVGPLNADQASAESHAYSRTWREAESGERLAIYLDALSEIDLERMDEHLDHADHLIDVYLRPKLR